MLKRDEMPARLKKRIWNKFYALVFERGDKYMNQGIPKPLLQFIFKFWDDFVGEDTSEFLDPQVSLLGTLKQVFFQLEWNDVYNFIDFFSENYPQDKDVDKNTVFQKINEVLEQEKAPYRIVGGKIAPLISEEEIKEIKKALAVSDKFKPVRDHLDKALTLMSDRKKPDYLNSIKESISAIESLVKILQGKKGKFGELIKKLDIHPALIQGFSNLYGWTSDEGGIRHPKTGESLESGLSEARYMLITCSAFINYVIAKEERTE